MQTISIFTDGACSGNPGPGGWGAVLICQQPPATKEINGAEINTTNNRMEMMAVIAALEILKSPCKITITTDSRYVCDAFLKNWIRGWLKNGWKTASKQPVKNQELWERMLTALEPHQVTWRWVKGHNEHPENERADALAVEAREAIARRR